MFYLLLGKYFANNKKDLAYPISQHNKKNIIFPLFQHNKKP
jgi:hypothetical protein